MKYVFLLSFLYFSAEAANYEYPRNYRNVSALTDSEKSVIIGNLLPELVKKAGTRSETFKNVYNKLSQAQKKARKNEEVNFINELIQIVQREENKIYYSEIHVAKRIPDELLNRYKEEGLFVSEDSYFEKLKGRLSDAVQKNASVDEIKANIDIDVNAILLIILEKMRNRSCSNRPNCLREDKEYLRSLKNKFGRTLIQSVQSNGYNRQYAQTSSQLPDTFNPGTFQFNSSDNLVTTLESIESEIDTSANKESSTVLSQLRSMMSEEDQSTLNTDIRKSIKKWNQDNSETKSKKLFENATSDRKPYEPQGLGTVKGRPINNQSQSSSNNNILSGIFDNKQNPNSGRQDTGSNIENKVGDVFGKLLDKIIK